MSPYFIFGFILIYIVLDAAFDTLSNSIIYPYLSFFIAALSFYVDISQIQFLEVRSKILLTSFFSVILIYDVLRLTYRSLSSGSFSFMGGIIVACIVSEIISRYKPIITSFSSLYIPNIQSTNSNTSSASINNASIREMLEKVTMGNAIFSNLTVQGSMKERPEKNESSAIINNASIREMLEKVNMGNGIFSNLTADDNMKELPEKNESSDHETDAHIDEMMKKVGESNDISPEEKEMIANLTRSTFKRLFDPNT